MREMFACLTRAYSWDESDSPCEPYNASKPFDFDSVFFDTHKHTDDRWHTPYGSPAAPPGLPSTPQSSWQPSSNTSTTQGSWVFRMHVFKQPDEPAAVEPVVLGPPDEPAMSKPLVPEIVHPVQYGILPHLDTEIRSMMTTSRPYEVAFQLG